MMKKEMGYSLEQHLPQRQKNRPSYFYLLNGTVILRNKNVLLTILLLLSLSISYYFSTISDSLKYNDDNQGKFYINNRDYTRQLQEYNGWNLNKRINWKYNSIISNENEINEHVVLLGVNFSDYLTIYKRLCINHDNGKFFKFDPYDKIKCSGYNKSNHWLHTQCSRLSLTSKSLSSRSIQFQTKLNKTHVVWINDLSIIQGLEPADTNVAHIVRRFLFLHHVLQNIFIYSNVPRVPLNLIIVPAKQFVLDRFTQPFRFNFYHLQFLRALIHPFSCHIGNIYDFLLNHERNTYFLVHILKIFSTPPASSSPKYQQFNNISSTCFRTAIIPSYLNQRFFINDYEYPTISKTDKLYRTLPKDSITFRNRLQSYFNKHNKKVRKESIYKRKKEIILLDRSGGNRIFEHKTRKQIIKSIKLISVHRGYSFSILDSDYLSFAQQYHIMKYKTIAIGIHGANLANAIFMPPNSTLIEIFPFAYHHDMYIHGGNSGLKYVSYTMSTTPVHYPYLGYYNNSVSKCTKMSGPCKTHYKKQQLIATGKDMYNIKNILNRIIEYSDSLTFDD